MMMRFQSVCIRGLDLQLVLAISKTQGVDLKARRHRFCRCEDHGMGGK